MKFNLSDFLQLDTKELLAVNGGFNCNGSSNTTVYPNTYYPSTPGGAGSNLPSSSRAVVGSSIRLDGTIRYDYDDGSHLFVYPDGQRQFYPGSDGKSKENNGKDASSSSGGGSCSTSTSNNPNGQGPSTTSSNPGGNQHKDTKIHSGGGTCTKTGGHSPVNPNPTNPDDVTSGGGTCSSKNDTDKVSEMFGQITDGSYADKLTMQYYKKNKDKYGVFTDFFDDSMNGKEELFSKEGCKMTAVAKVASQASGTDVGLYDINTKWDANKDGLLTKEEICLGLNNLLDEQLGDVYDVKTKSVDNPTLKNLNDIANDTTGITYVLGKAADVHGGEHWVVLEGYSTNSEGTITFNYDGTSDNDGALNRSYVIGQSNVDKNIHNIVQIQTFTVYKK